jgi:hypothetical protein
MSLELRMGQIDNSADNVFYNAFFNTVDSATDDAVDNAVDTLLTPTSSYPYSILVVYRIMASEVPLFDRYVPMASSAARAHARADHQNTISRTPSPRPLPQDVVDRGHQYTIAQRV